MDIVERLRSRTVPRWTHSTGGAPKLNGLKHDTDCQDAADEIERLRIISGDATGEILKLLAERDALKAELAQARAQALEEAAKVCEDAYGPQDWIDGFTVCKKVAAAIRAMNGQSK